MKRALSAATVILLSFAGVLLAPSIAFASQGTAVDDTYTVDAGGLLQGNVNSNDLGGGILYLLTVTANGSITLYPWGGFDYQPDGGFTGVDGFDYQIDDGESVTGTAHVTITVTANTAPVASYGSGYPIEETAFDGDVSPYIVDAENDPITAELVDSTAHGTLTFRADGTFTYLPDVDFNGQDFFTFRGFDGHAWSNTEYFYLTVSAVDDFPIVTDEYITTAMNTPVDVTPAANDYDIDGTLQPGIYGVTPGSAPHGTLATTDFDTYTYTPDPYFHGSDSFTYLVYDDDGGGTEGTVHITVTGDNIAPTANAIETTTAEDTTATGSVLASANDLDHFPNATLSASLDTGATHGTAAVEADGSYSYTPNANWFGTDSFGYEVSDGEFTATATVTVTVSPVNDAPSATPDAYFATEDVPLVISAPGVLANDFDPEDDAVTATVLMDVAHGILVLNANGSFTYTPEADYSGADGFSYQVSDSHGLAGGGAVVNLTVVAVNDAPVAQADSFSTDENVPLVVDAPGVLDNDSDIDSTATAQLVTDPSHGVLTLAADGSFSYLPDTNFVGDDSFTYRATDGLLQSPAVTVTIAVSLLEFPPVAADDLYSIDEDGTLSVSAPGVLSNDSDGDGDALTASVVDQPAHGILSLATNGAFSYVPDADWFGIDSFSYYASDATDDSLAEVTITVDAVDDAPVATAKTLTLASGAAGITINLVDGAVDIDGGTPVVVDATNGANGTVTCDATSCTYVPAAGFAGTDGFSYRLGSGGTATSTGSVTITVTAAAVIPVALASTGVDARALVTATLLLLALGAGLLAAARRARRSAATR